MARPPKANKTNAGKNSKPQAPRTPQASVLPMQLRVGDRFTDETGEWEIMTHPATAVGGKTVRAKVRRISEPAVTEERTWSAYERITVKRV